MCVPNLPETIYQIRNKSGLGKARFARWCLLIAAGFSLMARILLLQVPVLPWVGWDLLMINLGCVSCVPVSDRACLLLSDLFEHACVLVVAPPMLRVDCLIETDSFTLV